MASSSVFCVLRRRGQLRSGLLAPGLSLAWYPLVVTSFRRHRGGRLFCFIETGAHSMWPEVGHQMPFNLRGQTTKRPSSASATASSRRRSGLAGPCLPSVASLGIFGTLGAGADMSLVPKGSGSDPASDACRLTRRMQRTAQSVMRFAFANRPPLCSAADARR
jgi:hypothetical protein